MHTPKEKDYVVSLIFLFANIEDITVANSLYPFNIYINDNVNYPDIFEGVDKDRLLRLLDLLNLKVQSLKDDSKDTDMYSYLYENDMYALTLDNIKVIFNHNKLDSNELDKAVYTTIESTDLVELKSYVNEHLPSFLKNIMLASNNVFESADEIALLINNDDIKITDIIELINHNITQWNSCKDIIEEDVVRALFDGNKIKMSFDNIMHYCSCLGTWDVDNTLVAFINVNLENSIEVFTKLNESKEEHQQQLLLSIVLSDEINDNIAFSIFKNRSLIEVWNKNLSQFNETRIRYVIDNGIILITPNIYKDIIGEHRQLNKYLLCKNSDVIINKWQDFTLDINTEVEMLSWAEYKTHQSFILSKIDLESITPSIANTLLTYFSQGKNVFNLALYAKAMEKSNDKGLKVFACTSCLEHRLISIHELPGIFSKSKDIFEGLEKQGETYSISKQIEGVQRFMNVLHQLKYIGQIKEKGDCLTGHVLKNRQKNNGQ